MRERVNKLEKTSFSSNLKRKKEYNRSAQRKRGPAEEEDLLVFGYEAKLFRDDELALRVNRGEFMIPFAGSNPKEPSSLILDRYDVRNLLDTQSAIWTELSDTSTMQRNQWEQEDTRETIFDEEKGSDVLVLDLLERERYGDLDSDEELIFEMDSDERNIYIEEKRKRQVMEAKGNLYSFDYNQEKVPEPTLEDVKLAFSVPSEITKPTTQRQADIVERTATFIASSSDPVQMEIMVQVKQSRNPLFAFLNKDDPLYGFYRYVLQHKSSVIEMDLENTLHQDNTASTSLLQNPVTSDGENIPENIEVPQLELKQVIDKTASFVARADKSFEALILERYVNNPTFNFLQSSNTSNPYYIWRVQNLRSRYNPTADSNSEPVSESASSDIESKLRGGRENSEEMVHNDLDKKKADRLAKAKMFVARLNLDKS
ncbi:uncharacterized protein VTP21DRAFT_6655 [Calcarisporiella thermophila]|uniref:uncharacterized protein n=1 Tax=Calcarisporiella thermophila TaxID=911321 RepID=UPI0037434E94